MLKKMLLSKLYEINGIMNEEERGQVELSPDLIVEMWHEMVEKRQIPEAFDLLLAIRGSDIDHYNGLYILFKNGIPIYTLPVSKLLELVDEATFKFRFIDSEMTKIFDIMLRADVSVSDHTDYLAYWTVGLPVKIQ